MSGTATDATPTDGRGTVTIERRVNGDGNIRMVLTECPVCGHTFSENDGRGRRRHFLDSHGPEDFGLAPLGQRTTRRMGRVRTTRPADD